MTRDDVIRMARDAGFPHMLDGTICGVAPKVLEEFANLVAAAERERLCGELKMLHDSWALTSDPTLIRARGKESPAIYVRTPRSK